MKRCFKYILPVILIIFCTCNSIPGKDSSTSKLSRYYKTKLTGLWKLIETKYPDGYVGSPKENEFLRINKDGTVSNPYIYGKWDVLFRNNDSLKSTEAILFNNKNRSDLSDFHLYLIELRENKVNQNLILTNLLDHSIMKYHKEDLIE